MSQSVKNRTQRKSISRFFVIPVRFIFNGVTNLLYSTKEIALLLIPTFGKGRRNRDFDKAGRESQKVTRRRVSSTAFRKGEQNRKREIIEAERESRRFHGRYRLGSYIKRSECQLDSDGLLPRHYHQYFANPPHCGYSSASHGIARRLDQEALTQGSLG